LIVIEDTDSLIRTSVISSLSIATRLQAGRSGFNSWQEQGHILNITAFRPAPRPTLSATQRVPSFPEGKATKAWIWQILHLVPRLRMRGAILLLPHPSSWCGT